MSELDDIIASNDDRRARRRNASQQEREFGDKLAELMATKSRDPASGGDFRDETIQRVDDIKRRDELRRLGVRFDG